MEGLGYETIWITDMFGREISVTAGHLHASTPCGRPGRRQAGVAIRIYLPLPAYHRLWARHGFDPSDWSDGGSDRLVDACLNWGDLDTITGRVDEFRQAGVTRVLLAASPPAGAGSEWELIEALAPSPHPKR